MSENIDPLAYVNPKPARQQTAVSYYPQRYPPPMFQPQVYDTYTQKLCYEREKAAIEVQKERELNVQRLELENLKQEIRLRNKVRQDMFSFEVCKDAMGRIMFSRMGDDQEEFCSKTLLNVNGYRTVNLMSFWPQMYAVLSISWEGCREAVYFKNTAEGIPVREFLNRLKANGVLFRVSKRNEREVADALLSYSISTQEEYEIPFFRGWNLMGDGKWHFAKEDEICMKEILNSEN